MENCNGNADKAVDENHNYGEEAQEDVEFDAQSYESSYDEARDEKLNKEGVVGLKRGLLDCRGSNIRIGSMRLVKRERDSPNKALHSSIN